MIPIEISPNTIMLRGISYDSNIYLFRDGKEGLIIDTGTGIYSHIYFEVFEKEGYLDSLEKVMILNTHEHFDHIGGNRKFKELLEKRSIVVKFSSHKIAANIIEMGDDYVILSYAYGKRFIPHMVDVKLDDGDIIEIGSKKLEVIHTPGHTAGSICVYEPEEKIIFTGDTLFKGTVGRTDLPTGSFEELMESLNKIRGLDISIALPGHGKPITNWKENFKKILG